METEKLRPCPFCGGSEYLHEESGHVWCSLCTMDWVSKETWENSYCWKELDSLRAENRSLKLHYEELEHKASLAGIKGLTLLDENKKLKALCDEMAIVLGKTKRLSMGVSMELEDEIMIAVLNTLQKYRAHLKG